MNAKRLLTLLSAAAISGAMLTPTVASAHSRHDSWSHYKGDRWASPPANHVERHRYDTRKSRHHKHDTWSRRDKRNGRVHVYVADPRRPPHTRYPAPSKLHLGNGITIIYR